MTTIVYEDQDGQAASEVPVRRIKFTVNGEKKIAEVEPRLLLAHLIRRGLGLTGTHMGCDTTNCCACTVLVDGRPVKSCTMLAVQVDGREISTVEGLATASELHPLQEGFKEEHGLQCGFCTPGMMMAAKALLDEIPDRPRKTCAGRCPATSAAAPATRTSRSRCCGPPPSSGPNPVGGRTCRRHWTNSRSAGWARAASALRTIALSAARATTPTTSRCPACCTWRSCAARWRTRGSSRSTPARRGRYRASTWCSPAR